MKRSLSLLLCLAMFLALAACGQTPATSSPTPPTTASTAPSGTNDPVNTPPADEGVVLSPANPVTITLWLTSNDPAPAKDNKTTKLLKDELGVTLDYEITTSENQDMRIGTLLAGGEYPDILGTGDIKFGLVKGGAFLRLNDYLESGKYPLLKTHVEPYMDYLSYRGGEVPEGLYVLPNYNRYYGEITGGVHGGPGFWIQKAVLEDAGYPDLTNMTIERYFELIENYKNKYPTIDGMPTIGFEIPSAPGHTWGLTNPPALLAGSPNNGGVIVDSNNKASIFADSDYAYRWFKYLNEMNAKGLVDTESFTQTDDQYRAKLANGNVLGMHDQHWFFEGSSYASLHAAGKDERTWVAVMPTFDGIAPWYADRDVMNVQQGMGVSVSCKQVDVVLTFLETMMSEKWQKILHWGFEGEDYTVGADGLFVRSPEQRAQQDDPVWKASNFLMAFRDMAPKHQGTWPDGNTFDARNSKLEFFESLADYDKQFLSNYNKKTWKDFVNQPLDNPVYYPCWNIALTDDAQVVNTQMEDTSMDYLPRAIMAAPADFDKIWGEYVTALRKLDIATYESCIDAGIQERITLFGG